MDSPHVRSFSSIDDLFRHLKDRNEQATAALHPRQQAISLGSFTVGLEHNVLIFGDIFDRERFFAENEGSNQEETQVEWDQIVDNETRGRAYGRFFSITEPDGEIGSNHKLNLWPINELVFDEARSFRWEPQIFPDELWDDVFGALVGMATHLSEVRG